MSSLKDTTYDAIGAHREGWQAFFNGAGRSAHPTNLTTASEQKAWQGGWDAARCAAISTYKLEEHRLDISTQLDAGETMAREVLRNKKLLPRLRRQARTTIESAHRLRDILKAEDGA